MAIHSNSHSIIEPANNEAVTWRKKHIDITFHFVRNVIQKEQEELDYIQTNEKVAKPPGRVVFGQTRKANQNV